MSHKQGEEAWFCEECLIEPPVRFGNELDVRKISHIIRQYNDIRIQGANQTGGRTSEDTGGKVPGIEESVRNCRRKTASIEEPQGVLIREQGVLVVQLDIKEKSHLFEAVEEGRLVDEKCICSGRCASVVVKEGNQVSSRNPLMIQRLWQRAAKP